MVAEEDGYLLMVATEATVTIEGRLVMVEDSVAVQEDRPVMEDSAPKDGLLVTTVAQAIVHVVVVRKWPTTAAATTAATTTTKPTTAVASPTEDTVAVTDMTVKIVNIAPTAAILMG